MNSIVLKIGEKEVGFLATAGVFMRYKNSFGSDFYEDMMNCKSCGQKGLFAQTVIERYIWVLAKTYEEVIGAKEPIPPCQQWLDSFELSEFKYDEIYDKLQPIISDNLKVDRKNE